MRHWEPLSRQRHLQLKQDFLFKEHFKNRHLDTQRMRPLSASLPIKIFTDGIFFLQKFTAKICVKFSSLYSSLTPSVFRLSLTPLQWGAADAEIKVPSDENTELKGSPVKVCSRSYIAMHARLLPGISSLLISTLPVHSPALFPKLLPSFSCVSFG